LLHEKTAELGRIQAAGVPWESTIAGPDVLDEVIVIGDHSGRKATVYGEDNVWATRIVGIAQYLLAV
jgi:hypothetical protein